MEFEKAFVPTKNTAGSQCLKVNATSNFHSLFFQHLAFKNLKGNTNIMLCK